MTRRSVFFISDGTGITAETLGHSLLSQFDTVEFEEQTLPYVDSAEKALAAVQAINERAHIDEARPIVIDTIIAPELRSILRTANAFRLDVFDAFVGSLEQELSQHSANTVGKSHAIVSESTYGTRIDAVHFALDNDDGARTRHYDRADLILIGVSRSGKTPTSIYMALQFGIHVANYPLTEEDLVDMNLPAVLRPFKKKLFGLTIEPQRLAAIRHQRKPDSRYATLRQCEQEIRAATAIYNREGIHYVDSTHLSIEEISTKILAMMGLKRRLV